MDQQSTSQKTTEKPSVGQVQEESLLKFLTPEQELTRRTKPVADGESSSDGGTSPPPFKSPVQASTPHEKGEVTGEATHVPISKPDDQSTVRAHEELPINSEEKLSVQESGDRADQDLPPWLAFTPPITVKAYTNSKDLDAYEQSYKLEVMEKCRDMFKQFPKALGLIVLFACSVAASFRELPPVPGVVKGVDKMMNTFRHLGYAILRLPVNLASWQYKAAMKAVASLSFPETYRHIFVYYTGHGGDDSIDTPDGNLKLEDITKPFSPIKAPHLEYMTKIFIFDTCSSLSNLDSILPQSVLVFPAQPGYPAFAGKDDCGLLTEHLAALLPKSPKSFGDIVIDVTDAVTKKIETIPRWSQRVPLESRPVLCQTLKSHVCLAKERMEAMTPSIINRKVWPTSISVVISLPPSSVQFHLQHVRLFYKCEGAQEWTQAEVHAMPKETVFIHNLSHGKHYTIRAVAVYPNNEEIDSQETSCEMPTGVEPVLRQNLNYCHVDSVEFEVCQPAKKDDYQMRWFEVVYRSEDTPEPKPVECPENERVRICELEPGVQYTVTATAHYPNEQSVSATESFEIPKNDVTPKIDNSESQKAKRKSITVSVTAPPKADDYHLLHLSAEIRQANNMECQPRSIPVDRRGETATFRNLSSSTTYEAKAIATYPSKVVPSDPIQSTTAKIPYCKYLLGVLIFVITVLLLVGFVVSLYYLHLFQSVHAPPAVTKFGQQRDTIVVSDFDSRGLASVNITECPEEGDDPHTLKAALVKKNDVIKYMKNYTGTINGSAADRVSLLEDEHFLQESHMAVNVCLSSPYSPLESSSSFSVFAFVFDSSEDNQNFLLNESDGFNSSVYYTALPVGSTSQPICTWVNYSIASPAYYYLSLGEYTLGALAFSADLHLHEIYLNITDYEGSEHYCSSVSEMQPCRFKLRDSLKRKEYVLVSYICSRPEWFSPSTHVCAKYTLTNFSVKVRIVKGTLGATSVLLIAVLVVLVSFLLYKCINLIVYKCRGYGPVSDNVYCNHWLLY